MIPDEGWMWEKPHASFDDRPLETGNMIKALRFWFSKESGKISPNA
ncbi:MAG: hypothetical protein OXF73_08470 [Gammaproteobacteria bacterium]|nr:hypothetical protein [Gammaproteobacteria bacterium]